MNTREYDHKTHAIETSKPMRYHMLDSAQLQQNRIGPFDITASNELRSAPTRLNYQDIPSTPLYGTAPFKARNAGPVDIESTLFHGERFEGCNKPFIEEHLYFDNRISLPVPLTTNQVIPANPESTRVAYRNQQMKMN